MSEYFCAECGNVFRDAEGYHRISCSKKTEVQVLREENASLRARVAQKDEALRTCEMVLSDQIDKAGFATNRVALFSRTIEKVRAALPSAGKEEA